MTKADEQDYDAILHALVKWELDNKRFTCNRPGIETLRLILAENERLKGELRGE